MEFDPRDQDIIKLLTRLKDINAEYPENMLVARRQNYLKRMAEIGVGLSGGPEIKNVVKNIKSPHVPPVTGTLLETALLVVILVEAGAMAYFYREKLADFFQTITTVSRTEEVTPPIATSLQVQGVSPSPAITSTTITGSLTETTVTPTRTPTPGIMGNNGSNTPGASSLNSTPAPNGNNGNHYGQTPKPERTKENNENNSKPPKNDDKPPKNEPKPMKAK